MRARWALLLGVSLALAACGQPQSQAAAEPVSSGPPATGSGTILFVKGDDLWTMQPDGSHQLQLTHETAGHFANNPAFSPDGAKIAYNVHTEPTGDSWGGSELHLMNADGTGDQLLEPAKGKGERSESPSWTADGKSLYFAHDLPTIDASNHYTGDSLTVDRLDLASGASKTIVQNATVGVATPDGGLLWESYDFMNGNFALKIGAADGTNGRTLLTQKDFQAIYNPRLSPDAKTIVFSGSGRVNSQSASIGAALASLLNPLVPGTAEAHGLPWDPWTIGVDGKGLTKIMTIGSDEQSLAWSPDGKEIAMSNLSFTFLMRADGGGAHKILNQGDVGGLDWKK